MTCMTRNPLKSDAVSLPEKPNLLLNGKAELGMGARVCLAFSNVDRILVVDQQDDSVPVGRRIPQSRESGIKSAKLSIVAGTRT